MLGLFRKVHTIKFLFRSFFFLFFILYIFNEVCGIEIKTSKYFNFSQTLCVDDSDNESNDGLVEERWCIRRNTITKDAFL